MSVVSTAQRHPRCPYEGMMLSLEMVSRFHIVLAVLVACTVTYSAVLQAHLRGRDVAVEPPSFVARGSHELDLVQPDARLAESTLELESLAAERELVVLHFWATWCHACVDELDDLVADYEKTKGEPWSFLAITKERDAELSAFLGTHALPFAVASEPGGELHRELGIASLPTTVAIDRDLRVVERVVGPLPPRTLKSWIERHCTSGG